MFGIWDSNRCVSIADSNFYGIRPANSQPPSEGRKRLPYRDSLLKNHAVVAEPKQKHFQTVQQRKRAVPRLDKLEIHMNHTDMY